jgi:hypothetical protein
MDRLKLLFGLVIALFLLMILVTNSNVLAQESRMYPLTLTPTRIGDTPTPPPAPEPTIAFTTGQGIDTNQNYAPKANSICWTWNHIIGRIGPFSVTSGKQLLVIKFLVDQSSMVMNNVVCEESVSRLPEERASWANNREPWYYPWSKIETYYVGSNLSVVTLTPTLVVTSTPTPSLSPTITKSPTPKAAPNPTYVFYTGDSIDTLQYYAPKRNELCITWNHIIGRIGPYFIPAGKSPLILKFTENQSTQPMVVVWCEDASNHTPEERLSSLIQDQPCCYTWERGVIKYIGFNMQEVTLTPTASITNTPSVTSTSTVTATPSATSTSTVTASNTPWPTATITRSRTSTPSRTITPTRSKTPTATESLGPNVIVPQGVSTLVRPKDGNVCYGEIVGNQVRVITEFVSDINSGIEISGGGCFTRNNYSLSQILRYLESRGIGYNYTSLPKPTLTPSRTLVPTVTIVSYIHIGLQTDRSKRFLAQAGTICWGNKVSDFEYKVVKFHKGTTSTILVTNGGCYLGENLSAEDVYNYLRRRLNLPLNGFVDVR